MQDKLKKLKALVAEAHELGRVAAVLDWDQQVNMPHAAAGARACQTSIVSRLAHEKFTSAEIGELLEECAAENSSLEPDSDDACLLKVLKRDYERQCKVPSEYVAEFSHTASAAHVEWEKAKNSSDFKLFEPSLKKIFDLRRQYSGFFAPYDHIYDPLLNEFEPGMKTAAVLEVFEKVRPQQVELIKAISERPAPDCKCLQDHFVPHAQWELSVNAAAAMGYDFSRGRLDKAVHPFTTTFSLNDVRITTAVSPETLAALHSTMHEAGHAIYEQNISQSLEYTPLATGASLAIHESQSRMWENIVGRSRAFLRFFYPEIQKMFPQLKTVPMETFYRAINKVSPGFIRVEADEATYNMHVMLRLELEIAIIEGRLAVADLPSAWNEKMRDYLGITPPNDGLGCLQDVHWSAGLVGYFPTYALGNMISAQIWECVNNDVPDLEQQIERGEFEGLRGWLKEKLHRHGSKFEPCDLIKRVTGSEINPEPYLNYLRSKYSEIYGL
ncbi:MAG: carboxypeptidase M32 [Lentisphaerae bacterium]|nr:carboxypeptidase M32 [Lentisphaerota bacterium]MCP4101540.1 carboxypeptidase M32 [Lentisphaerota bacterium]